MERAESRRIESRPPQTRGRGAINRWLAVFPVRSKSFTSASRRAAPVALAMHEGCGNARPPRISTLHAVHRGMDATVGFKTARSAGISIDSQVLKRYGPGRDLAASSLRMSGLHAKLRLITNYVQPNSEIPTTSVAEGLLVFLHRRSIRRGLRIKSPDWETYQPHGITVSTRGLPNQGDSASRWAGAGWRYCPPEAPAPSGQVTSTQETP